MMDVLYLQGFYSKNSNPLKGRQLYDRFRTEAQSCRLGYVVAPDIADSVETQYRSDIVTYDELEQLKPDLIFLERGLVSHGSWRIPEEIIEREVSRGAALIISDVNWNALNEERDSYMAVSKLCRVEIAYEGGEPLEIYDPRHYYMGEKQIVCHPDDMAYEPWLAPLYEGLPNFVVGNPVPMRSWIELVATCNRSTTLATSYISGMHYGEPASSAFACATRLGLGYLVLITGNVSDDVWAEVFPGNTEWLTKLSNHLTERIRIDRRLGSVSHQIFVSHRHANQIFAHAFRDELRRRGFGTWLDVRELIAGAELTPEIRRAIEESTHFALLWSADCVGAEWIRLELQHADSCDKRILVVRLDDTPIPAEITDKLRIEAQAIQPTEAAKLVALNLEREERKRR
jgi:hypothetical protein